MTDNQIPPTEFNSEGQFAEQQSSFQQKRRLGFQPEAIITRLGLFLLAITPVVTIYCSGSRQAWSLSLAALLMAICMVLLTPRRSVPWSIWVPLVLAMILGLSFALSAGQMPEWRTALQTEFQIDTGLKNSPHPWISFERWLMGGLGLTWLAFVFSLDAFDAERRFVIQTLTAGLSLIIIYSVWIKLMHLAPPKHWHLDDQTPFIYGPFPNRNHFAGMCAISGILSFACSYDSLRRNTKGWIIFVICLVASFSALMINTSRFGVLMFFIGCVAWMMSSTMRDQSARKLALFSSISLIGTTFLLIFGQHILKRFFQEGDVVSTLANDGRISIFKRTIEVLTQTPWHGWGVGTFNQLFAILDPRPNSVIRVSHPESDLLWLIFEFGLPATLLVLLGVMMLLKTFRPWTSKKARQPRSDRRLRNAAAICVLLIIIQGFVDVPLHMIGMALLVTLLAGLGSNNITRKKQNEIESNRKYNFRYWWKYLAAAFCLFCAFSWFSIHRGNPIFPSDTYARKLLHKSRILVEQGHEIEALKILDKVTSIRPLHWDVYFQRASLKVSLGYPYQQALQDFARARALEKNIVSVPYTEAQIWEPYQPALAISAYAEAIRRDPTQAKDFFHQVMNIVQRNPNLRYAGRSIARSNPKLHLSYLLMSNAEEFKSELNVLLENTPELDVFSKSEKLSLFKAWYDRADRNKLFALLKENPDWMADGWLVIASHHAQSGDFQSACKLGFEKTPPPIATPPPPNFDVDQLTRLFLMSPTDIARGLQLYEALKAKENNDEALRVLNELSQLPSVPNKILYEKAFMLNRKKEYAKSWDSLLQYISTLES